MLLREYQQVHLGRLEYGAAWRWQRELAAARQAGQVPDTLGLVEHPHVYTLGRSGHPEHILIAPAERERRGIAVFEVDRGGDVTYHGPGQLVGYPILDLGSHGGDLRRYVYLLEEVLIRCLADFGIAAARAKGLRGVWLGRDKLAAIGVRVTRGITSHGFALNVDPDLWFYDQIIPCGIRDRGVTSMARILGRSMTLAEVMPPLVANFEAVFGYAPAEPHHVMREETMRFKR